jgi:hypothetical protein
MNGYFEGRHALSGIAEAEERIAFGMTPATFMELIRTEDFMVIRAWNAELPPDHPESVPSCLAITPDSSLAAKLWRQHTGDEATYHALTGRLP